MQRSLRLVAVGGRLNTRVASQYECFALSQSAVASKWTRSQTPVSIARSGAAMACTNGQTYVWWSRSRRKHRGFLRNRQFHRANISIAFALCFCVASAAPPTTRVHAGALIFDNSLFVFGSGANCDQSASPTSCERFRLCCNCVR